MTHQDFEKYAKEKSMQGKISSIFSVFFEKEIYKKDSDLKILDFGCGDGKYFSYFKNFFKQNNIYGIEISQTRVDRCKNIGWHNVQKINPLEKLPFNDETFDIINFDQVIEHIPLDTINFYLDEFKRTLKPGGMIIVMTPNYPIKRWYDFLNFLITMNLGNIADDPTHITHYNFKKLNKLFSEFTSVKLHPTGGLFYKIFPFKIFSHKIIGIVMK